MKTLVMSAPCFCLTAKDDHSAKVFNLMALGALSNLMALGALSNLRALGALSNLMALTRSLMASTAGLLWKNTW